MPKFEIHAEQVDRYAKVFEVEAATAEEAETMVQEQITGIGGLELFSNTFASSDLELKSWAKHVEDETGETGNETWMYA